MALVTFAYAAPAPKDKHVQEPGPPAHDVNKVYHALGHKQLYVNKVAEHHGMIPEFCALQCLLYLSDRKLEVNDGCSR